MRCMKCMEEISDVQICPYCGYVQGTAPDNAQALGSGNTLAGRYLLGDVIGAGGFGITYVGWDKSLQRKVAIKEYFPSSLATRAPGQTMVTAFSGEKQKQYLHGKERFMEEARLLMRFAGEEGIVAVYDVVEANNSVYMVMEYVDGITLKESIERFGVVPEEQLMDFIIPVLLSLKFVHNIGYIHRDIAPDNIKCLPDGSVKLLDFGAARYAVMEASQSLSVIVKQGYTPMEQYQTHGRQGPCTDIYAIAATMYKALTGITPEESLERLENDTLKTPSQCGVKVSSHVENAIMTALNVRPEDRPQDIDAFIAMLMGETTGVVVTNKKKKKGFLAAVVVSLALLVGIGGILYAILRDPGGEPHDEDDPQIINVPNVIRKQETEAEKLLQDNQLGMIVTGGQLYDAEMIEQGYIEENQVVSQDPAAQTEVEINSNVGVVLSKGKEKEYVPSVTDMMGETALEYLTGAGFGDNFHIEVDEVYSDTNMVGTVISQSLPEDSAVDFDGTLTLTISLGSKDALTGDKTVTVKDYTGQDFQTLKESLLKDDIYLVKSASIYSNEYPYGAIISQAPERGETIHSGGAVYVVTSLGMELARVPDVRYMDIADAKKALMKAGLSWKISYIQDPLTKKGLVAAQMTDPGRKVNFGTAIELQVSGDAEGVETVTAIEVLVSPDNVVLTPEQMQELICSYTGEGEIIWASSNPYIAEVTDNGKVTGKHFGAATVSAAVDGNIALSYIMVEDDAVLTSMEDYTLEPGETVSLASAIPEQIRPYMEWYTSNPAVATVDHTGLVKAGEEGYTSITGVYKEQVAECGITVLKEVKYIKIPRESLLGTLKTAQNMLSSHDLTYAVEDSYNATIVAGNVIKLSYVGHKDNDNFYIQEGTKVTLFHSLGKNTIQSLTVKKQPQKTVYFLGEKPVYTGLVLEASYRDGTVKEITSGYAAPNTALQKLGAQALTIAYDGASTYVNVTVNPVEASSIQVTPDKLSCYIGDKKTISVAFTPANTTDKSVTVTSDKPSVVKVSGTQLTALKAGSATITVTSANGIKATCTVTVTNPPASSISLSQTSMTLDIGESWKLTAALKPAEADASKITWSSADKSIATVDNTGKVTGIKAGTTKITAQTDNGKKAICTVTVSPAAVEKITVSPVEISLKPKDTQTLKISVSPKDADTSTITWASANTNIATVDKNGKVTAVAPGITTVTVSSGNSVLAVCQVMVRGQESLVLVSPPAKTQYYTGDSFQQTGLKLRYTDAYGNTTDLRDTDFRLTMDMYQMGTQTVTATYNGLTASFSINIKEPSIQVNPVQVGGMAFVGVVTEPENASYTLTSSDETVFYFQNNIIVPVLGGTAYAYATMVYNGVEYSDYCRITIEAEVYDNNDEIYKDDYNKDEYYQDDYNNNGNLVEFPNGYQIIN